MAIPEDIHARYKTICESIGDTALKGLIESRDPAQVLAIIAVGFYDHGYYRGFEVGYDAGKDDHRAQETKDESTD